MTEQDLLSASGTPASDGAMIDALRDWLERLPEDALAVAHAAAPQDAGEEGSSVLRVACEHLLSVMKLQSQIEDLVAVECAIMLRLAAEEGVGDYADVVSGDRLRSLREDCALLDQAFAVETKRLRRHLAELAKRSKRSPSEEPSEPEKLIAEENEPSDLEGAQGELERNLIEQVAEWGETYLPPTFTANSHILTRLRAFLRSRISADGA